jgi:hypothetical protein
MSGTPIFDELYAKYVAGAANVAANVAASVAASVAARPATAPVPAEPQREQPAAHYTGRHQTLVWPS